MRPSPDWISSAMNRHPARPGHLPHPARQPSSGISTPASPCTGSISTAAVVASTAAASAARS
ncbi:hypothetical protein SGLAM104S_01720 [Streptomyces glaucescens]